MRSKVRMERIAQTPQAALPSPDMLHLTHYNREERKVHWVGQGHMSIPVELIPPREPTGTSMKLKLQYARSKVKHELHKGKKQRLQLRRPDFTPELQAELKDKLNGLCLFRVKEFRTTPRALRHFLRELESTCEKLQETLVDKSYRSKYPCQLLVSFCRLVPQLLPVSPPVTGLAGEMLPTTGFLTLTVLHSLLDANWEFTYSSTLYKACDCTNMCDEVYGSCKCPVIDTNEVYQRHVEVARMDMPKELHLPEKLPGLSQVMRKCFMNFALKLPALTSEFLNIPPVPSFNQTQAWIQFLEHWSREVVVLDQYYAQFEQLFLTVIERMIRAPLEPVRELARQCELLNRSPYDPFRPVNAALLCQRLELLKGEVDCDGANNLVQFDPSLLNKARRVLLMETHEEFRNLARSVLTKFEALCIVIQRLQDEEITQEVKANMELREAFVGMLEVWVDAQFALQQDAWDFVQQLLEYMPKLDPQVRRLLSIAIVDEYPVKTPKQDASFPQCLEFTPPVVPEEQVVEARKVLYETLPLLLYLDEISAAASRGCFCFMFTTDDAYASRDLAKWDEQRHSRFKDFLLSQSQQLGKLETRYFQNVERQLLDSFGFAWYVHCKMPKAEQGDGVHLKLRSYALEGLRHRSLPAMLPKGSKMPFARAQRQEDQFHVSAEEEIRRLRWACLNMIAQKVQPDLFQLDAPAQACLHDPSQRAQGSTARRSHHGKLS